VEIVCRRYVGGGGAAAFVEELGDVVGWLVGEILGTGDTGNVVEKGEENWERRVREGGKGEDEGKEGR